MKFERPLAVASILACALWLGGMLTLGAIVAPIVFHTVSMPYAADAMTLVFRRFDRVVIACSLVLVSCEVARLALAKQNAVGWARIGVTVLAAIGGTYEAMVVSPAIAALHEQGAMRGVGDLGKQLDDIHHVAERIGSGSTLLLVAIVALHVFAISSQKPAA